jgi:LysM repeat protein
VTIQKTMMKFLSKGIILLILISFSSIVKANVDSIGIETINGSKYILHKVQKGEGLYGIARKYKSTVTEIQELNNLTNTILDLGQIIKVPSKHQAIEVVETKPKQEQSSIPKIVNNPKVKANTYITHTVKRGETLYLLSRKYDVSVTEISKLNKLKRTSLELGQKLKIPKKGTVINNQDIIEPTEEEQKKVTVEKSSGTADVKVNVKNNKLLGSIDYNETGIASWIEDKNIDSKKSIALHKSAPVGTIIRVTNLMNNKSIYVKVIGKLPDTGDNENTIIVLSKAAVNMLGGIEQKFRVNLNYSIPK